MVIKSVVSLTSYFILALLYTIDVDSQPTDFMECTLCQGDYAGELLIHKRRTGGGRDARFSGLGEPIWMEWVEGGWLECIAASTTRLQHRY